MLRTRFRETATLIKGSISRTIIRFLDYKSLPSPVKNGVKADARYKYYIELPTQLEFPK